MRILLFSSVILIALFSTFLFENNAIIAYGKSLGSTSPATNSPNLFAARNSALAASAIENRLSFILLHNSSFENRQSFKHLWTIPSVGEKLFTDNLGNAYVIKGDALTKYRENGTVFRLYSNKNLGKISHVDPLNPLKIVVFYKDFSQVLFLDNTVTENGNPIKLQDFGLELASLVAASYDNGIWVFDQVQYTLTRFDQQLKPTVQIQNLQQILGYALQPVFLAERENHLYMSVPDKGILQFDIFGTYVKTIPVKALTAFQVIDENLYYTDTTGNLKSFGIRTLQENSIPMPVRKIKNFRIEKDHLFLLREDSLSCYIFPEF